MKLAHTVHLTVFCREGEDPEKIRTAIRSLIPFNLEEEKVAIHQQTASGFNEKKILILEIGLGKEKHTNEFIQHLKEKLGSQCTMLLDQKQSRLDDQLQFFIRLDKEKLLKGEWCITDGGSCFHIRLSLAAFPKNRMAALDVVTRMFA